METAVLSPLYDICTFRCKGKMVFLSYCGKEHKLFYSKGMQYLITLIANPDLCISCVNIETIQAKPQRAYSQFSVSKEVQNHQLQVQSSFQAIPLTDLKTVNAVKQELIRVIDELAELEANCDYARADNLRDRYEALVKYLEEVYNPEGKIRNFSTEEVKIRKRVLRAINRCLGEIEKLEPELGAELKNSLKLGANLYYHPTLEIRVLGY